MTVFALVANAANILNESAQQFSTAFASYVGCEAAGNSTVTCERTELNKIVPIQALFDMAYVLFVILPAVNLLYAMNVSDMKALKQRFVRYCLGWCRKKNNTNL